ncbi:MAG TPA: RHS repeat-associated core domain-containing protein [Armatimonadota bacterium]|jgi:RHS repeat-associated protein
MNASGTVTAVNTFGADGLVSRRVGSASTFYMFDSKGNAANQITSGVATNIGFDAFGARQLNGNTNVFQYGAQWGYYTDAETTTGLVVCGHRYYDPATGRWLTRDPIGYSGGINLYGYVGGDPVNGSDPSGYSAKGGGRVGSLGLGGVAGLPGIGGLLGVDILYDTNGDIGVDAYVGGGFCVPWKSPALGYSAGPGVGATASGNCTIQSGCSTGNSVTVFGGLLGGGSITAGFPPGALNTVEDVYDMLYNLTFSGGAKFGPTEGAGIVACKQITATLNISQTFRDACSNVAEWWSGFCSQTERQLMGR